MLASMLSSSNFKREPTVDRPSGFYVYSSLTPTNVENLQALRRNRALADAIRCVPKSLVDVFGFQLGDDYVVALALSAQADLW